MESDDEEVARLSRSLWSDTGEFEIRGTCVKLSRTGVMKDVFVLESDGSTLAEVKQGKAISSKLSLIHDGEDYELRRRNWYSKALLLESQGSEVGHIEPRGFFSRAAIGDLPKRWPLQLQVFVLWIALVRWDREDHETAMPVVS